MTSDLRRNPLPNTSPDNKHEYQGANRCGLHVSLRACALTFLCVWLLCNPIHTLCVHQLKKKKKKGQQTEIMRRGLRCRATPTVSITSKRGFFTLLLIRGASRLRAAPGVPSSPERPRPLSRFLTQKKHSAHSTPV